MVDYDSLFRMPSQVKITGRSSSITNSFINGIAPTVAPTTEQIKDALNALGMEGGHIECVYCGSTCTEWDHLNPLVRDKMPTGYITEINNLVPACGKCNQSKGNRPWREWMVSDAPQSPKSRGVDDLEDRIQLLSDYEELFTPVRVDFRAMLGDDLWSRYWKACDDLQNLMKRCQVLQDEASETVKRKLIAGEAGVLADGKTGTETPSACDSGASAAAAPAPKLEDRRLISDVVRKRMIPKLKTLKAGDLLVAQLEDIDYCEDAFGIHYPLLKPLTITESASAAAKDECGRNRYWVTPILIDGERYLVCSQWYDRHREALGDWLSSRGW